MAKPNYQFAKRQRDLAKKQKKEEKKLKKSQPGEPGLVSTDGDSAVSAPSIDVVSENKPL